MKTMTKSLIILSGAAAVGCLSAYLTTKCLVDTALDRQIPRIMKRSGKMISGSKSKPNDKYHELRRKAEESFKQTESHCETVSIRAADNELLVGHLFQNENSKRLIIAVHGWRSSPMHDFALVSDFWRREGCSILFIEQRGQGESGGEYIGFGLTERYDCKAWAEWAALRFDLPIYLSGVSMGAATVLMASDLELPDKVKGIIADCGFTSPDAIWKYVVKNNLHLGFRLRGVIANSICKQKLGVGSKSCRTTDSLKRAKVPVLFIHGSDDRFVPVTMTYENYKACASEKRLLIVPGAGHGMSCYVDPDGYEKAVMEFWKEFN